MPKTFDLITETVATIAVVLGGVLLFIWLYENVLRYIT